MSETNKNKDNLDKTISKIENNINKVIDNYENSNNEYKTELDKDIENLEEVLKEMKAFIDDLKRSKSAIKSISEMYSNLISLNKLVLDTKEKRYKLTENDIKHLKSLLEIIQKVKSTNNDETTNGTINIVDILKGIQQ